MNDLKMLLILFVVLVILAWFVHKKAQKAGSFTKWLWMGFFGSATAVLIWGIFTIFVHMESWVWKQVLMIFSIWIFTPAGAMIGGWIYEKQR